jgi:hypothetical protein
MVAGKAERFDGNLLEADAKVDEYRGQGKTTAYLFVADTEEEFGRKWAAKTKRTRTDSI